MENLSILIVLDTIFINLKKQRHTQEFWQNPRFCKFWPPGGKPTEKESVGCFKNDPLQLLLMTFLSGEPSLGFRIYLVIPNF